MPTRSWVSEWIAYALQIPVPCFIAGRMVETKLRMVYGESREDAVRLERKISDAIFEKELEILGKNRCFN